ncbi:MAG: hypothetical protein WC352_04420 [Candidatus Omnitrophota bacterium]|jgi:hypothetical protein
MPREYLRTYREYDWDDVRAHLLILGDLSADCASCRALGIDASTARECPECKTAFKYVTSRRLEAHPGERFPTVRRFLGKRPELIFIDFTDYQQTLGHKKARDFFG